MRFPRKRGSTSVMVRVFIPDNSVTTGAGLAGLTSSSTNLVIAYMRELDGTATTYTGANIEAQTTVGTYQAPSSSSKVRFKAVDATNFPGLYEIQFHNSATAFGTGDTSRHIVINILETSTTALKIGPNMVLIPLSATDVSEGEGASLTGNVGGNVVGSVASVTGAVGSVTGNIGGNVVGSVASVTGAVGSVTGNVGGNVVGSVASVTGAVGSVTGNLGGNVVGSVASVTARVTANVDQIDGASWGTHATGMAPADVRDFGGSAGTFASGRPEVNTTHVAGTAQTAGDIPARLPAALAADGSIKASIQSILGTAFTEGAAGRIAAAFKQFFNIASPTSTMNEITLVDTTTTLTNAPSDSSGMTTLLSRIASAITITGGKVDVNDKTGFALTAAYDPAKTAAQAGDAMALTSGERTTLTAAIWDSLTSGMSTVGSIGKRIVDFLTGDAYTRLGAPAGASVSADIAAVKSDTGAIKAKTDNLPVSPAATGDAMTLTSGEENAIVDKVWDEAIAGHLTAGTTGAALNGAGSAGDPWLTLLPGSYGAGTAGKIVGDNLDAKVSTRLATSGYTAPDNADIVSIKAKTDNLPTDPADASDIASSFSTVNATLSTIAGYVDTEVAAIKAKTDNLPASPAATGDAMTLTSAYDAAKTAAQAGDAMTLVNPTRIQKNVALPDFEFVVYDSTDHVTPKTGRTVTATRSIDGGAFGPCANSVTEVGNGVYVIDLAASDLNGNIITLRFTAANADAQLVTIVTELP